MENAMRKKQGQCQWERFLFDHIVSVVWNCGGLIVVYQGRSVLSAEFQLHRMLPGIGNNSKDLWSVIFWTRMVRLRLLDNYGTGYLPYKQPQKLWKEKLGILRYVMFALALSLVSGLFLMQVAHLSHECGGQQRIPQAEEWNGVHSLLWIHEGLPHKGFALR